MEAWDGHSMDWRRLGVHHMLASDVTHGKGKMEGSIWESLYVLYYVTLDI